MRNSIILLVVIIALGFAVPSQAADLKIGVVNVAQLVGESPQAKQLSERLKQEFASREREIMSQQNDLRGLQEKFQRDAEVMSESERTNTQRRMRELERDLQFRVQSVREDAQRRQNEELGKLQRELGQAIQEFAKAEGYDLILTEGVAFRKDAFDVTAKVLQRIGR